MEENILLAAFAVTPIVIGSLLYFFFKKATPHFGKAQWLKLAAGNILVFLFLCSFALPFGELYYRFFYDSTDSWGLTKVHSKWQTRHYHYNNFDMRDSMDYENKLQGKTRVTFIGDSFTAGHGVADVEKRFVNRIRKMRPDWEIHTFAVNGWDTYGYMDYMQKAARAGYEYDHVVLVYNLNDISDVMEQWKDILHRIYFIEPPFLFKHSYFLNLIYYHYFSARTPEIANYYGFINEGYSGPSWEKHKFRLSLLKPYFDSEQIDFMVVTFPFLHNIGPNYEYRKIHEQMDAFWKDANVPNLDLLPVLERYEPKDLIVSANDPHPNEMAHEIAAKAILSFIEKNMKTRTEPASAAAPEN